MFKNNLSLNPVYTPQPLRDGDQAGGRWQKFVWVVSQKPLSKLIQGKDIGWVRCTTSWCDLAIHLGFENFVRPIFRDTARYRKFTLGRDIG